MTPIETAWVAGLFEGEGTIGGSVDRRSGRTYWQMNIRMTDQDVVERLHAVTGVGTLTRVRYRDCAKPLWKWTVAGRVQLGHFVPLLLPHMGERRAARMRACLEWCAEQPAERGPQKGTPWSPARRAAERARRT